MTTPAKRALLGLPLVALALTALVLGAFPARAATVTAQPTSPIPGDAPSGPPPIPTLPSPGDTQPPPDQIADPLTPSASCSGWYLQNTYGGRWPTGSNWWEYQCSSESDSSYDNCSGGGACNASCDYCYVETESRTDYFYWTGSDAVFSGEAYYYSLYYWGNLFGDGGSQISAWWDAPTAQWYSLEPVPLDLTVAGAGAGVVTATPGGSCVSSCELSIVPGTVVTLTATANAGSTFTGWSGDCTGTGSCQLTMNQAHSVTATFAPNAFNLTITKQGPGTGQVNSNPSGINCGGTCQASFANGTTAMLTATPDPGSIFAGWSGDCTGGGSCQLTMSQARSVSATFAPNLPPTAKLTLSCTSLTCNFDGSASSDPDDAIVAYAWSFGDGASGSGRTISHTYPKAGSYTVTLTVTDNAGASNSSSQAFNPISVSARGYKQNGVEKVDLSWNATAGTSFDVYRNNTKIVSLQGGAYTDTVTGRGTFTYKVCAPASSTCSNQTSVTF